MPLRGYVRALTCNHPRAAACLRPVGALTRPPSSGSLIDGSVFDSSRKRGKTATFAPNGVIPGWTEALQMMRPGDRWMLYIPASLGYGERGAGGKIPGGATLIFDLELFSFEESAGLFAGLGLPFFDSEVLGPIKLWMVILALIAYQWAKSGGRGGDDKSVNASHILVKDEALCKQLKEQVSSGQADFAALAKQHSTCPSGKSSGGSLGAFRPGQMVAAFDEVCWKAPIGVVQGPVQTQFGYHLILVTERTVPPAEEKGDKKGN
jgi:hypothetical protein